MSIRNHVNNQTNIWGKSTPVEGIVSAKYLGWVGTQNDQEIGGRPARQDQSVWGAVVLSIQPEKKYCPSRGKGSGAPCGGTQKSTCNNKVSLKHPLGPELNTVGDISALPLISSLLFHHLHTSLSVLEEQEVIKGNHGALGHTQGTGGVLTMNKNQNFNYYTDMDILITEMKIILALK